MDIDIDIDRWSLFYMRWKKESSSVDAPKQKWLKKNQRFSLQYFELVFEQMQQLNKNLKQN